MINLKNIIFAHRGIFNNIDIPENSIPAFKKALKRNIPIELDIHIIKDNTIVVFHDHNLKRMTNIDKDIKDYTYEELKKIKLLDTNYHIPTLEEVLKLVNKKVLLNIEIKDSSKKMYKYLTEILDNYDNFIIQSFHPTTIKWFKRKRPNYYRGLLLKKQKFHINNIFIKYSSPQFLSVSKHIAPSNNIQKYKNKKPILIWTINNKQECLKYKKYSDGLIKNNL